MTATGARVAAAARALVGVRFRVHGRDPAHGLDCVGLVAVALRAGGFAGVVPTGYPLRGGTMARLAGLIEAAGLVRAPDSAIGDVVLCITGPAQFHFAIDGGEALIHADAVLRRVVERPHPVPWPPIGRWRLPHGTATQSFFDSEA